MSASGRRDRALRHLARSQKAYAADRERRDPPPLRALRIEPEALERMGERVRRITASFTVKVDEKILEKRYQEVNPSGSGLNLFDADDFARGAGQ